MLFIIFTLIYLIYYIYKNNLHNELVWPTYNEMHFD